MKKIILLALSPFLFAMSLPEKDLYQVITAHPEILELLIPNIETVSKQNRLWIVKVTGNPYWKTAKEILRPIKNLDIRTYQANDNQGRPANSNPEIVGEIAKLSQSNIKNDIVWLSSYKARNAGSPENRDAKNKISDRLKNLGFQVSSVCYQQDSCSLIADLPGQVTPSEIILVMGHLDSVGKDFAGADDNASGTAVTLEMARILSAKNHKRTLRIFITNGEENGLLGSTHYAKKLEKEGTLKNIITAINMDMVSYNSNGLVEIETNSQFESLAIKYSELAATYTSLKSKITLGAWGSDHVPFLERKIPTVLTIEDWQTKTPCYHQACDRPATLNFDYALEIAKLNLAAVLHFDSQAK